MRRVLLFVVVLLAGCGGASDETAPQEAGGLGPVELVRRLQDGGLVVYLRHAATDQSENDAGLIDPADCTTQRNLNDAGRAQARAIGKAFRELRIPLGNVLSSEYCRTRQTAELAFGRVTLEPDLTGFPNEGDPIYDERLARTRELLGEPVDEGNTVLVAHVNNIEAAAEVSIEEGELAVFEPKGDGAFTYLGHVPASAWPQLADELGPGS